MAASPPVPAPQELARRAGGGIRCAPRRRGVAGRAAQLRAAAATDALVQLVLRRGHWSLHRHVHLVAAFEQVADQVSVRRLLSIGSGAALTELYLAATHPDLAVTISDVDADNLGRARRRARGLGLANVRVEHLDLLDPRSATVEPADLVVGIEVLEHIEDDRRAAARISALSRSHVYQLVPHCTEAELADPEVRDRAWRRHQHHRPGYTGAGLAALFATSRPEWIRTCYLEPEATALRQSIETLSPLARVAQHHRLVAAACADVGAPAGTRSAAAIEILTRVD